jgi:hypothetical protein
MTIKDVLKKDFWNSDKLILKRFKSSKFLFIIVWFLFFLDFFLLSNFPKVEFFVLILPFLYICFIVSLLLITYYSIKIKFKEKINLISSIILTVILAIIWLTLSIPFLVDSKTLSNLI